MNKITLEQWNLAASSYAENQEQSEYANVNRKTVSNRFTTLNGQKVLDLGCGYGWYTNFFANIGADVIGCDGSNKMIEIAKKKYPTLNFECLDIENSMPYENETFDLVFCNQVLMDIENIESVFEESYRMLKEKGIFYFSIVHPAFYDGDWVKDENDFAYAKTVSQYLSDYKIDNDFFGKTTHYHRSISKYVNLAIQKGFNLINVEEPITYDGIAKTKDLPLFLFCEFEKR